MQKLSIALGTYGLTKPLKDGQAPAGRLPLDYVAIDQIVPAMRRMCRGLEYDICEMAFTTYVCARAAGKPFTAIPVFVTRNFHHWAMFYNAKSGIRAPKDLEGRKVGVNRGYTVTTGLWARGMLQSEYGVDLEQDDLDPDRRRARRRVRGAGQRGLQPSRQADARPVAVAARSTPRIGEVGVEAPEIKPLIPDARNAAFDYFRRTGIYPINHGVVVKNALLKDMRLDRRRAHRRVRGGEGDLSEGPGGQRRASHHGTRPRPTTPRWSATPSRSASTTTARRWRRSPSLRSIRRWCRASFRSRSCSYRRADGKLTAVGRLGI